MSSTSQVLDFHETRYDGVVLRSGDPSWVAKIYPHDPWGKWGGITFNDFKTAFQLPSGERVLFQKVLRAFGAVTAAIKPYDWLDRVLTFPNGQVKNFLVACRTVVGKGEQIKICVRGSKSQQGGGIWHKYFALFCSLKYSSVFVDFFDPNEIDASWTLEEPRLSCQWFARAYEGRGEGYDVVVDDAWVPGEGVIDLLPISRVFSLKGVDNDKRAGFVPFLHTGETRTFSHPGSSFASPCPCMVCRCISSSVECFSHYSFLRSLCTRLGHTTSCGRVPGMHDISSCGDLLRELETRTSVQLSRPSLIRVLMSVSEEVPLSFTGGKEVFLDRSKAVSFVPLVHGEGHLSPVADSSDIVPWLMGKKATFVGVDPSVFGRTRFSKTSEDEVLIVKDVESWTLSNPKPTVLCNGDLSRIGTLFPHYRTTGRCYLSFREFVVIPEESPPVSLSGVFPLGLSRGDVSVNPKDYSSIPFKPYYIRVHPDLKGRPAVPLSIYPFVIDRATKAFDSLNKDPEKYVPGMKVHFFPVEMRAGVWDVGDKEVLTASSYNTVIWRHPRGGWGFLCPLTLSMLSCGSNWRRCSVMVPPSTPQSLITEIDNGKSLRKETPSTQLRIRTWYYLTGRREGHLLSNLCSYLGVKKKVLVSYFKLQLEFQLTGDRITLLENAVAFL